MTAPGSSPSAGPTIDDALASGVAFNADGLVPVVVQEHTTRAVLMLAWMDAEALRRTARTGRATYWSRSRGEYWVKGETSGHVQHVRALALDCDADTVLLEVDQTGPACHTGTRSCFTDRLLAEPAAPAGDQAEGAGR